MPGTWAVLYTVLYIYTILYIKCCVHVYDGFYEKKMYELSIQVPMQYVCKILLKIEFFNKK